MSKFFFFFFNDFPRKCKRSFLKKKKKQKIGDFLKSRNMIVLITLFIDFII